MAKEGKPGEEFVSNDEIDTERNLFETIDNDFDDDDDDNDDDDDESYFSLENVIEEDDDEDEDDQEDEEDDDDDQEDEDDDNNEITEDELELLNKKLGTDFKNAEDLKNSLSKKDADSDSEKEEKEYTLLSNRVNLYDKFISMDNETLVRNQLISEASSKGKDVQDEEVLDAIEEKLEGLKDLDTLDKYAETLRSNLQTQKDKTQASIDKIDAKRTQAEEEIVKKNINDLQEAFAEIYLQKEFMGVTLNKKDIQEVYNDIRTNKFFESVNGNQEVIAKLALFLKYENEISKVTKNPTQSDKTKDAFSILSGNGKTQRRSIAQANGSASSGSAQENLSAWLK